MALVIGIDAGGSKTTGLLADATGAVLAEARSGGANLRVHGEAVVETNLFEVIDSLAASAPGAIGAFCLGLAGVDRPDEKALIEELLRRHGYPQPVRVVNDAYVALVAGAPGRTGIVVVAGTGSIAYGIDPAGNSARSGGWGYLLGDEGSAFWLGHAAVRAGIRAQEDRGPATALFERIWREVGVNSSADLLDWFYDPQLSRARVARLAGVVQEAADDGDDTARGLLDQAAQHLARAARAVAKQLTFPGAYPLVLSGGAFRACPSLAPRVEAGLHLPAARVVRLSEEPATGAVRLALDLL